MKILFHFILNNKTEIKRIKRKPIKSNNRI